MKIYDLDDEIVVDSIPFTYDSNRKIFLTTLVHIEVNNLLPKVFSKIYTSEPLKRQLQIFLRSKDIEISDDNFHVWKPFQPEVITLSNGIAYEVLPCCPEDITTGMLLVFRQDSIITHVYVGLCSELRSTLLNTTLITWFKGNNGRTSMYIPYSDACKRCVFCEYQKAITEIEERANSENTAKLLFYLPLFGSELFISKIAFEFPRQVALSGLIKDVYMNLPAAKAVDFADNIDLARFIITSTDLDESISINLERNYGTLTEKHIIKWSPLPSVVEMSILTDLVQPSKVYGITFKKSHAIFEQPVKVLSVVSGLNHPIGNLKKERIQRQFISGDKCCLEESEKIRKKVTSNLKRVLQQVSLIQTNNFVETSGKESEKQIEKSQEKEVAVKPENNALEQIETSNNIPNPLREDFNVVKADDQESLKEQHPNQQNTIVSNPPSHIPIQKPTTSAQIIVTELSIKIPRLDLSSINCNVIKVGSVQQNKRIKQMSTNTEINKDTKCDFSEKQQNKNERLELSNRSPCTTTSSLVYRRGKRGIGFIDDDSSSSE